MSRFFRQLACLGRAGLLGFVLVASAQAHSTLERSEPKAGAVLKSPPNEIRIWFTEPIKTGLSTIDVRNQTGEPVGLGELRVDQKEPSLVILSLLPNLGAGAYTVSWTAVAQDMHVSKGSFRFRIAF